MTEKSEFEVLYRNAQWMVQRGPDADIYLVEVKEAYPDDLGGGFYIEGFRLATAADNGHTELLSIAEKSWVDIDLLEPAARKAIELSGVTPNYDLDKGFAEARLYRGSIV